MAAWEMAELIPVKLEENEVKSEASDISLVESIQMDPPENARPMLDLEHLVFKTHWPEVHEEYTRSMMEDDPQLTQQLITAKTNRDETSCRSIINYWKYRSEQMAMIANQ